MPEADTVWRVAQRLNTVLAGQPLRLVELRWPTAADIDLTGRSTLEVTRRAKHILHRIEGGWTLRTHLGLDGMWQVWRPTDMTPTSWHNPETRAVLGTDDWLCLGQRLRMVDVWRTSSEGEKLAHLGPDILAPDWNADVAASAAAALSAHGDTIGAAMLDQRPMSGVGTLWSAEVLFAYRTHPWLAARDVDPELVTEMVDWLRVMMLRSVEHPVPSVTGSQRRGERTYVHARSGHPCRRCGTIVRVQGIGPPTRQRPMFYCPTCQGGLAPGDRGGRLGPLGSRGR
ncbi:DNA-formamidopyrimidine glycosylase family protein [Kribbia dieselivorans]|uniref:DNA-formamidopyrimidine glycosylase family protein n=1 Tax=Kribbia dieselivorans TaxID=331526 RepID=UPI00083966A2|nr:DNA-formamidopyrimidine glycosylase family protein [Kribbia dieselivorans]